MPRLVSAFCVASVVLSISACADSSSLKHPPQDPPDYKGVPTDTTPPSMIIAPASPQKPQ